jgi:hypothetical protein
MLIECIAEVSGTVETAISNDVYVFRPDAHGRLVCDVDREEHQAAFLALAGVYRAAEAVDAPVEAINSDDFIASTGGAQLINKEDEHSLERGRAIKSEEFIAPFIAPDSEPLAGKTWDELAALYEAKFDRKPHSKTSLATLIERLT